MNKSVLYKLVATMAHLKEKHLGYHMVYCWVAKMGNVLGLDDMAILGALLSINGGIEARLLPLYYELMMAHLVEKNFGYQMVYCRVAMHLDQMMV